MQDTTYPTPTTTRQPLRRLSGPVGGVAAGLARTLQLNVGLVRTAIAVATFITGPVALVAYLVAWLVMPVDPMVPVSERPSKLPPILLAVVAVMLGIGLVIDILTWVPTSVLVVGVLVAWYFWSKKR